MSTLKGLRQKRDAALKARHLDLPVPGLEGVVARFRPVTAADTQREAAKVEKARDKHAANIVLNATVLARGFDALIDEDGSVLTEGISADLVSEFCPDMEQPSHADVMVGLFTDDFPLFKAGGRLVEWSQGVEGEVDGDLEN